MGNIFSGRRPEKRLVRDLDELNVTKLAHADAFDGRPRGGHLEFPSGVILEVRTDADGLVVISPFTVKVAIAYRTTPTAEFPVWLCPKCGDRYLKLYVDPARETIACRNCLDLVYRRCRYSHRPAKLAAYRLGHVRRKLHKLREEANREGSRYSENRQRRIAELEEEFERAEEHWEEATAPWTAKRLKAAWESPLLDDALFMT